MEKWFVYILECEDKSLYTGVSTDVERRFSEHRSKKGSKYTASHKPVKIVYIEVCKSRSEALIRESQIKGWSRNKKISILKLKMPG